jgi:hypothetical protein
VVIWFIFLRFGTVYQEKSGNPALEKKRMVKQSALIASKLIVKPSFAARNASAAYLNF